MDVLKRLVETASVPDVEELLKKFGAVPGNHYAPWTVPRSKKASLYSFLIANSFEFVSAGRAKSTTLEAVINIKALGNSIVLSVSNLAKAYTDTKPQDLVAVLEERLTTDLGTLRPLPVKVAGKYEVLLWSATAGKLNTVAKALKALDFSVIKMDNQKVVSGTRLEVDGGTTYVVYMATSGLVSLSSTTRALRG